MWVAFLPFAALFPMGVLLLFPSIREGSKSIVGCALLIAVCMAAVSYGFEHSAEGDISRYMARALMYGGWPLSSAISDIHSNTPLAAIWLWLVGKTGNPHLLPASAAFVNYFCLSYIALDYTADNGFSQGQYLILVPMLLGVFPIFFTLSAVRSTPALMLFTLSAYVNLYKGKTPPWTFVAFASSCLLHSVGYIMLLCLLLARPFQRHPLQAFVLSFLALSFLFEFPGVSAPLARITGIDFPRLLETYTSGEGDLAEHVSNSLYAQVHRIVHLLFLAAIIPTLVGRIRGGRQRGDLAGVNRLRAFALAGLAVVLALLINVAVTSYLRFTYAIYPLAILELVNSSVREEELSAGGYLSIMPRLIPFVDSMALLALHVFALMYFTVHRSLILCSLFGFMGMA